MINFYRFYNKTGLDNEEYSPLIDRLDRHKLTIELKPIEHIIKKDPYAAYRYADHVLKERWIEAESVIMKEAATAFFYAKYIMKHRWHEAEQYIKKNEYWWKSYKAEFGME